MNTYRILLPHNVCISEGAAATLLHDLVKFELREIVMKKEITLSNAVGKILKGFEFSCSCGQAVLIFTDDTFATLKVDIGYDRGDVEIADGKLELYDFGDDQLIGLGVITKTELNEKRDKKSREFLSKQENAEREQYEILRGKYEI